MSKKIRKLFEISSINNCQRKTFVNSNIRNQLDNYCLYIIVSQCFIILLYIIYYILYNILILYIHILRNCQIQKSGYTMYSECNDLKLPSDQVPKIHNSKYLAGQYNICVSNFRINFLMFQGYLDLSFPSKTQYHQYTPFILLYHRYTHSTVQLGMLMPPEGSVLIRSNHLA